MKKRMRAWGLRRSVAWLVAVAMAVLPAWGGARAEEGWRLLQLLPGTAYALNEVQGALTPYTVETDGNGEALLPPEVYGDKAVVIFSVKDSPYQIADPIRIVPNGAAIGVEPAAEGAPVLEWYTLGGDLREIPWDVANAPVTGHMLLYGRTAAQGEPPTLGESSGSASAPEIANGDAVQEQPYGLLGNPPAESPETADGALLTLDYNGIDVTSFATLSSYIDHRDYATASVFWFATGSVLPSPSEPFSIQHLFRGWFTSRACESGEAFAFGHPIVEDTTVFAKWVKKLTVVFQKGIEENVDRTRDYGYGDQLGKVVPEWAPENQMFSHWEDEDQETWNDTKFVRRDATLTPVFDPIRHEVTFYKSVNGVDSPLSRQSVEHDSLISPPEPITLEGNEVSTDKWYADVQCEIPWNFESRITGDTALYLKVVNPEALQVRFLSIVDPFELITQAIVNPGDTVEIPELTAEEGMTPRFYADRLDLVPWDFDTPITQNTDIYVQWVSDSPNPSEDDPPGGDPEDPPAPAEAYVVTFVDGANRWTQSVKREDASRFFPMALSREGYTFLGWKIGAEDRNWNPDTRLATDVTLYAVWEKNHTVTFDTRCELAITPRTNIAHGAALGNAPALTARLGLVLKGWYDASLAENQPAPTRYWNFAADRVTRDMTLTADWSQEHTVSFVTNGGTAVSPVKVAHGHLLTPPPTPTRQNYIFGGWYQEPTFLTPWNFGNYRVTSSMTLFARWYMDGAPISPVIPHYPVIPGPYTPIPAATAAPTATPKAVAGGIALNLKEASMELGDALHLTATMAQKGTVRWTSSNPRFIVDADGNVAALASGTTVITATAPDGSKAECRVECIAQVKTLGSVLSVGSLLHWVPSVSGAVERIVYSSSDKNVASIDADGIIAFTSAGVTTMKATVTYVDKKGKTRTKTFSQKVSVGILPDSVTTNFDEVTLSVGESRKILVRILPANATNKKLKLSVSNKNVTVDKNGLITAKRKGSAVVSIHGPDGTYMTQIEVTIE